VSRFWSDIVNTLTRMCQEGANARARARPVREAQHRRKSVSAVAAGYRYHHSRLWEQLGDSLRKCPDPAAGTRAAQGNHYAASTTVKRGA